MNSYEHVLNFQNSYYTSKIDFLFLLKILIGNCWIVIKETPFMLYSCFVKYCLNIK